MPSASTARAASSASCGPVADLAVAALEHQERHAAAQQLGALGAAIALGQQVEGAAQRGAALLAPAERPLGARQLAEHLRETVGRAVALELGDRQPQQLGAAVVVDVGAVRGGGADEHVGVRGAGERLGVGHPVPDLQRPLEQPGGLAVGVHAGGGGGRLHAGAQRRRLIAGRAEVVRHPGGDPDVLGAGGGAALEGAGEREVQLRVLAGEQVVVDDLAQQRVAEAVHAVGARDDQVARRGLAHRDPQLGGVEPAGVGEQRVVGALGDGEHAQDLLRGVGEPLGADHQRVAQRRRQRAAAVAAGRQQLLGEQRVPLAAAVQALDERRLGCGVEDVGELIGQLGAGQARELDAAGVRVPLQLGQQRPQRVAAVHLVRAVGADGEHALGAHGPRDEGEEGPRGAVGPVDVLEQQQHRLLAAEALQQREQRLEETALRRARALVGPRRRTARAELGQQRGKLGPGDLADLLQHRVLVARERPQRGHQRRVGQLALPQLHAFAAERPGAAVLRAGRELGDEPGLAHARLPRDEGDRRVPLGGGREGRL